jgi:NTP pyrophosphatase (non-canonical NTP hydrolase)
LNEADTVVPDITVEYWLSRCRAVTEGHMQKHGSAWSMDSQIAHAHSEVAEVYQAIRHGESSTRVLEEICDSIYSALTMAHIAGFTDAEIMTEMEEVLRKIERRAGVKL